MKAPQPSALPPDPDEDEAALFLSAMSDVAPHRSSGRHDHRPPPPSTRARQAELDEREVLREMLAGPDPEHYESGDTLAYRAQGIQDSVWRKLRRGQFYQQAELDLHGMNRAAAQLAVARFLALCEDRGHRCVRIIHGKGKGSPNSGPVIKRLLDGWLRRRQQVLAFCSARPEDGGTGAVYVLLRAG